MKITDKNTGKSAEVQLRYYRGGWDSDLEPCCLADLAAADLSGAWDNEAESYMIDNLDGFVAWWQGEVTKANADPDYSGDALVGIPADLKERGDEWILTID